MKKQKAVPQSKGGSKIVREIYAMHTKIHGRMVEMDVDRN